jgi:DNA-binding CsgD family transcriptional regulator
VFHEPLIEREVQVLERLAGMRATQEIAGDLPVSVNMVNTHLRSVFLKFALNRRADAVGFDRALALVCGGCGVERAARRSGHPTARLGAIGECWWLRPF